MNYKIILLSVLVVILASCGDGNYAPKPKAYFRIDTPKPEYRKFDTLNYPYSFEYPVYANILRFPDKEGEKFWINLDYPQFNGRVHISYKAVNKNLPQLIDDANMFANKHIPKSNGIGEKLYENPETKVYGVVFDIKGSDVASSYQFFVTDSTKHFLRGALYFNQEPNNDSLEPVIKFIKKDIDHLIETVRWK